MFGMDSFDYHDIVDQKSQQELKKVADTKSNSECSAFNQSDRMCEENEEGIFAINVFCMNDQDLDNGIPLESWKELKKVADTKSDSDCQEFKGSERLCEENEEEVSAGIFSFEAHDDVVVKIADEVSLLNQSCSSSESQGKKNIQSQLIQQLNRSSQSSEENISREESLKNSNVSKNIGAKIVDHLEDYKRNGEYNQGVERMLDKLTQKIKKEKGLTNEKKKTKEMKNKFNTYHLKSLFHQCSEETSSFNLEVTRKLFNKILRKDVVNSAQLKNKSMKKKLVYLNTLKVFALRCSNKFLAVRLQGSRIQS